MVNRIAQPVIDAAETRPLTAFYGALLGMREVHSESDGSVLIGHEQPPGIAFSRLDDYRPPRWPDPTCPPHMHFDIAVHDFTAAERLVLEHGGTPLPDLGGDHPVFADPSGHPFCLYASASAAEHRGRIEVVQIDCPDAAALARFYMGLLDVPGEQTSRDAWLIGRDDRLPRLGFRQVERYQPPRWKDRAFPQQIHLDIYVDDPTVAEQLGATPLPEGGGWDVYADPAGHPFCLGVEGY